MANTKQRRYTTGVGAQFSLSVRAGVAQVESTTGTIAGALGISITSMSHKLTGKAPWKLAEVDRIAEIFGVEAHRMMAGPGDWLRGMDSAKVRENLAKALSGSDLGPDDTCAYQAFAGNALAAA